MPSDEGASARRLSGSLWVVVILTLAFGLFAWIGIGLTRDSGRVAALWIPNAIVLAAVLRADKRTSIQFIGTAFLANCATNLLAGDGIGLAIGLSLTNTAEVLLALALLHYLSPAPLVMSKLADLCKLVAASIFAPILSACPAAIILASPGSTFSADVWLSWVVSDGLGLLVVTPVMLIAIEA